jgi:hypothetical protein
VVVESGVFILFRWSTTSSGDGKLGGCSVNASILSMSNGEWDGRLTLMVRRGGGREETLEAGVARGARNKNTAGS